MKIWNPIAFFISLIMSLIMPAIFGIPYGLPFDVLIYQWPLRWAVIYFIVVLIVQPLSLKLAEKAFNYHLGDKTNRFWNPLVFFISLIMSTTMPLIFGVPMGLEIDTCFYLEPLRWITAYFLVALIINPLSFRLAGKIFGFGQ